MARGLQKDRRGFLEPPASRDPVVDEGRGQTTMVERRTFASLNTSLLSRASGALMLRSQHRAMYAPCERGL
eukprot:1199964-Pyramimonas_sp.AAC.1